jgi:4-hydroxy-tetrahydrodipicolinate synthase
MFAGTYTALVTPFTEDHIDEIAFERLIESQIEAGITGLVPVGTTGESPTLSHAEHARVIELAVKYARKRVPVIGGAGSNSTAEAISLAKGAEEVGADGLLIVAPYYNKPSQEGLIQHYTKIARSTKLPIVLYSIPARSVIEIGVETVARLAADCPNIVAIKEAGGSVERVSQLRRALPDRFSILSGDDSQTLPFMSVGASGVISVASHLIPRQLCAMVKAALDGNFVEARRLHLEYYPIFKDIFMEPSPAPIKAGLAMLGMMKPDVRLPLCGMTEAGRKKLEATLHSLGVLK